MMNARADLRDLRDDRIHRSLDLHHQQQYSSGLILSNSGRERDDTPLSMLPLRTASSFRGHGYTNPSFNGATPTKRVRFEDDNSAELTSPFMPDSPSFDGGGDHGLDTRAIATDSVSYDSASDEESPSAVVST